MSESVIPSNMTVPRLLPGGQIDFVDKSVPYDADRQFQRTFDRHADTLPSAFRRGEPPPVHARAGRRALALAVAAVESFESGRRTSTRL